MQPKASTLSVILDSFRFSIGYILIILLLGFGISSTSVAALVRGIQITKTTPVLNSAKETYDSYITLTNNSKKKLIHGPLALQINSISKRAVTVDTPSGTINNKPYIYIPLPTGVLPPQHTIGHLTVSFKNPTGKPFKFSAKVITQLPDINPTLPNHLPVAHAGSDQTVSVGNTAQLDGSTSTDPEGQPLSYQWTLLKKPQTSNAHIGEINKPVTNLAIDQPGQYQLQLIVNDGQIASFPDIVLVDTDHSAPVANAGLPKTVPQRTLLTLDSSASHDSDGQPLTHAWTLPRKPGGSKAKINPKTTESPTLTLDKKGNYTAQVIVSDGQNSSEPATVNLSTEQSMPVADAGIDVQNAPLNQLIAFSGSLSSDSDHETLSYHWSLLYKPSGSASLLSTPELAECQMTPDQPGDYIAQLIVNDGHFNSAPDTVLINVRDNDIQPVNHAPAITSTALTTASVGKLYTYDVDASDTDTGDILSFALATSPEGMTINPQTGLISWTPAAGQIGSQSVSVKVSDGKGGSDSQSFSITASDEAQATVPSVVDQNLPDAIAAIQQAKLNLGSLNFQHSNKTDGKVISQSVTAGSVVKLGTAVNLTISIGPDNGLPPNPATVAPILDPTIAHNVYDSTQFLYTGSNPIQTGVSANTIELKRAAAMRGRVLDKQNNPLSGVAITIKDHPEFGQTLSRADGWFDMVVNGGGLLTINYQKSGFLTAQRQSNVPWQDYVTVNDVIIIPVDGQVSQIDLSASTPMQVARASAVNDKDGTRQATLLFPQGTHAQMVMPDGSKQPITHLSVRTTEFTVGTNGPITMPAELPPTSGYTYAVVFTADEAKAAGAKDVVFDHPIPFYVDNFLDFKIGVPVPMGAYNYDNGVWVPSDSGVVIKILNIVGGAAQLDTDGDGTVDNGLSIGITLAERQQLAALYGAGKSLWRVPVPHFDQPWDANQGTRCKNNSCDSPNQNEPAPISNALTDPCIENGSVIECENQALGEVVPLNGTPLSLNYRSNRVAGYTATDTLKIPLSGPAIPEGLVAIRLKIQVAGQIIEKRFPVIPNQSFTFLWDGKDAFGRVVYGKQRITVEIGYVYELEYVRTDRFGYFGRYTEGISTVPARNEFVLWQTWRGKVQAVSAKSQAVGEWTFSNHHTYDPIGEILYLGDGSSHRSNGVLSESIKTIANLGYVPVSSAVGAAIAARPDGGIYVGKYTSQGVMTINLIKPNGAMEIVAGGGNPTDGRGDGGLALNAKLGQFITSLAVSPDGTSLYIGDGTTVRRVGPDGIIDTIAGIADGIISTFIGDGLPATQARLHGVSGLVASKDGSLYIADYGVSRIRRVGPDGIISTVAGGGHPVDGIGDGGPATQANLDYPSGLALGDDGSIYIAHRLSNRIRRVTPDGKISTFAGGGNPSEGVGDGGPATLAKLFYPCCLAFGRDGSLYVGDTNQYRVRRIGTDGTITTVAGTGIPSSTSIANGEPATATPVNGIMGIAINNDGSLLFLDDPSALHLQRVTSVFPTFGITGDSTIASEDGSELYQFNASGRHLRTLNALTGATLFSFSYNAKGLLNTITDATSNIITIERDPTGHPTAILAPFGQRTTLSLDANGYLAKATNPAGELYQMSYANDGLLTAFKDPNGNSSTLSYDTNGRLTKDSNAAGGSQSLARTELANGYEVSVTTALGRTTTHGVINLLTGDEQRTSRLPDGTQTKTIYATNGTHTITAADGTVTTVTEAPDPRFSMLAPIISKASVATGGMASSLTSTRTTTLSNPADLLSLTRLTDTTTLNGRTSTSVYDATTNTVASTSAAGRKATATIDSLGRLLQAQVTGIQATNLSYDTRGRLAAISQGASPNNRDTFFSYNPEGFLDTVTDSLGRTASFNYDAAGRITRQTLPDGREIAYSYDANNNLTSLTPPGRPGHLFHYTATNQTAEYEPPQMIGTGNTLYSYDLDKELTKITRPDGHVLDFAYNNAGRLSSLTLPTGQISYAYSATTGKLTGITAQDGGSLDYSYNGALLTKTAWTGSIAGSVERTYDNDFRVTSLSVNGANSVAFQYDADSLLTKAGNLSLIRSAQNGLLTGTTLGSLTDSYVYDGFADVTAYEAKYGTSSLLRFEYDHDKLGRITQKRQIKGGVTHRFDYGYDTAGRLIEVKRDGVVTVSYGYDSNGNRTHLNGVEIAHYDDQDRLLDYQGSTYQYTANGELTQKTVAGQTTQYKYDVLGNLQKVTVPNGTVIDYVIDGQNRRIGKKVNGALVQGFLYQGQLKPIAELDSNGNVKSRFVYATGVNVPDYMIKGGATYRIIKDHLGSPRLVLDIATNTVIQEMDYDAFGRVTLDTNPGFQPFGFAGGLYDQDTKLVRFGARDYEAETGRWVAKDPILFSGGDTNVYGYVLNDPNNFVDEKGLDSFSSYWPNSGPYSWNPPLLPPGETATTSQPASSSASSVGNGPTCGGTYPNLPTLSQGSSNPHLPTDTRTAEQRASDGFFDELNGQANRTRNYRNALSAARGIADPFPRVPQRLPNVQVQIGPPVP